MMKWRDSDDDATGDEGMDIAFDGNKFSMKKDSEPNELGPNFFKKNLTPFITFGAAAVVLIILLLVLFSGPQKNVDTARLQSLETKFKLLEDKINNLEGNSKQITDLAVQSKTMEQLKKQLDRLETTVADRMNVMANELESLKKKPAVIQPKKTPAPKKETVSDGGRPIQYHEVSAGENLYRIGLRYGLKVDELRRLNNLESNAVLRTGQKLRVSK